MLFASAARRSILKNPCSTVPVPTSASWHGNCKYKSPVSQQAHNSNGDAMTRIIRTCAGARYDGSGFWQRHGLGHFPDDETLGQGPDIGPIHTICISTLAESRTLAYAQQRRPRAVRRLQNLNPSEVRSIQADDYRQGWPSSSKSGRST